MPDYQHCVFSATHSITFEMQDFGNLRRKLAGVSWPVRDAYSGESLQDPAVGRLKLDCPKTDCYFPLRFTGYSAFG